MQRVICPSNQHGLRCSCDNTAVVVGLTNEIEHWDKTEQEKRHEVVKLYNKRMGGAGARSVSRHRQDLRQIKENDIAPCDFVLV
jgi:predicted Fe-S protein YdhL (DUF1289 family)